MTEATPSSPDGFRAFSHNHLPIYRVVRAGWSDPLDASFSRRRDDRRWNTPDFPALYCCCSERVARLVALDLFRVASVDPTDLQPAYRPQLVEIEWAGEVVDVVSAEGVETAGFPAGYPSAVETSATRAAATRWHAAGIEGVCCRSASAHRRGLSEWRGDHREFGEVVVYPENVVRRPGLLSRRRDLGWLAAPRAPGGGR